MSEVCAGIVTFNPDIKRLQENIEAVGTQVRLLMIFDNNSKNLYQIKELVKYSSNILLITNKKNLGMSTALNHIMEIGISKSFEWVLLLDQDSIVPDNLVSMYNKYCHLDNVGIICPKIIDRNSEEKQNSFNSNEIETVKMCITSGSLTNCAIWKNVGGFDDKLFIDLVDDEYCIRLFNHGYNILKVNKVTMLHEIGFKRKYWLFSSFNHSATRKYYMTRNTIYCARKYSRFSRKNIESKINRVNYKLEFNGLPSIKYAFIRVFKRLFIVLLHEKDKKNKIIQIIRGLVAGITMEIK